jgi:4-hydroxyphenylpyruvate dioxygenase
MTKNTIGLKGIEFVEFVSPKPEELKNLFFHFGFSLLLEKNKGQQEYFNQNDIHFIINKEANSHADHFKNLHGPSLSSLCFRVENAEVAMNNALQRGAKEAQGDYQRSGKKVPCIYGIGDSLIYFIDQIQEKNNDKNLYESMGFETTKNVVLNKDLGFMRIDHLTNNVEKGQMQKWANFYKDIFDFTEVRYFDIKGSKTGLISYALKSPCGTFCIPINEGTEKKSQINEYLEEYKGPGIQHLAFLTNDIIKSLDALKGHVSTLDIDDEYYAEVFDRVPNVTENKDALRAHNILIDGDNEGYLLQIFTKNIIGPIFIEIIQRKNHYSFGEGNFGALFRSIEKDQEKRGYLDE